MNAGAAQRCDEARARREIGQQQVVHVRVVPAVRGHDRPAQQAACLERRERRVVALPDREPRGRDALGLLELRGEERGDDLARQVRRADVDPGVLVDLAAEELRAVGALLADDLGALDEARVVDEQRAALAGDDVLGLVEAQRAERADRAERLAAVGRQDALRGILDDRESVLRGDREDRVHLAADAGVVHRRRSRASAA